MNILACIGLFACLALVVYAVIKVFDYKDHLDFYIDIVRTMRATITDLQNRVNYIETSKASKETVQFYIETNEDDGR